MVAQATRSAKAVSSVIDGRPRCRVRWFADVHDDAAHRRACAHRRPGRAAFLEQAQYLGGVMTRTFGAIDRPPDGAAVPGDRLDDAMQQLQGAAAPLLQLLSPGMRDLIQHIGRTPGEQGWPGPGDLGPGSPCWPGRRPTCVPPPLRAVGPPARHAGRGRLHRIVRAYATRACIGFPAGGPAGLHGDRGYRSVADRRNSTGRTSSPQRCISAGPSGTPASSGA
jgi:hypothetical protein